MRLKRACLVMATAAAVVLPAAIVAADTTERTTMPDFCSQRDVNCVLLDGPARVIAAPSVSSASTGRSAGDASGVLTLITPATGSTAVTNGSVSVPTGTSAVGASTGAGTASISAGWAKR